MLLNELDAKKLKKLVTSGLTGTEKKLLVGKNKDVNEALLDKYIDEKFSNELFGGVKASTVADGIRDDFTKNAMVGEKYNLIYVGGLDNFEKKEAVDRAQMALFYDVDNKVFLEQKIWGRHPGFKETDPFTVGHLYSIEIVPKEVEWNGEMRTFYNARKYYHISDQTATLSDIIKAYDAKFGTIVGDAVEENEFTEATITLLSEAIKYQTVPFEFELISIKPTAATDRVQEVDVEGNKVYRHNAIKRMSEKGIEENVPVPIQYVSPTGVANLIFSIVGKSDIGGEKEVTYFGTFYPSRMAQYFVDSPTIKEALQSDAFLTSTPTQQADFLKYLLVNKKFVGVGSVTRISGGNDPNKLTANVKMISMVEV